MLAKMTITGLHSYKPDVLWQNLNLPEGIDKDCFINEVLRQASEFPLLYPDLEFMSMMIGQFSTKWYHNFERWIAAYNFEYEALFNVDVTTTTTEDAKDTDDDNKNFSLSRSGGSNGNTENKKAAFDTSVYQPNTYDTSSLSTSESETHSESNSHSWEHSQTIEEVKKGNQGVTMSQEMLLAEYNAWLFNLYEHMAEIFVSEFCICIYQ